MDAEWIFVLVLAVVVVVACGACVGLRRRKRDVAWEAEPCRQPEQFIAIVEMK
jgi:hypothetical protein